MPPERGRIEAVVHGRVQGVGFRWFVRRAASSLGLVGWVRNESDGSVRLVAEGPSDALERLIGEVRAGPSGASVSQLEVARSEAAGGFDGFTIRSGAHRGD